MKYSTSILLLFITLCSYSQFRNDPYRDSDDGNFHIRNGKVFFQQTINSPINFEAMAEKLQSYNTPGAGFQTKSTEKDVMNGVLINYHLNWNYTETKTRKIADFLKNPVNATFEIKKDGSAYQVTVNNIWFMDVKKPSNKKHNTLESYVTDKSGLLFTKNKKSLEALDMIDKNFQWIFKMQGSTKDTRF